MPLSWAIDNDNVRSLLGGEGVILGLTLSAQAWRFAPKSQVYPLNLLWMGSLPRKLSAKAQNSRLQKT